MVGFGLWAGGSLSGSGWAFNEGPRHWGLSATVPRCRIVTMTPALLPLFGSVFRPGLGSQKLKGLLEQSSHMKAIL